VARALILGGGFGGIGAALRLRERLAGDDEVIVVDREAEFVMGLRKIWEIVGDASLSGGTRRRSELERHGIEVRLGTVEAIDPRQRSATVDGEVLSADALIVALGSRLAPDAIPGLTEHGINAWSAAEAGRGREALERFTGGRIVVGVFGMPYSCPPAPYELALRIADRCRQRGLGAEVTVFTPAPIALPVLGPEQSATLERLLAERGVVFQAGRRAVEVGQGAISFEEGAGLDFDLLYAVPPHRVPSVLVEADLAKADGWVPAQRMSMETAHPGVYAVGDCTGIPLKNGLPVPKAGAIAQVEGEIAAEQIAAFLRGHEPPPPPSDEAVCFAEVGHGEAARIRARLFVANPESRLDPASTEGMQGKRAFETDRLAAWFGG
jgi:sulfide:quinone oxidoreductase